MELLSEFFACISFTLACISLLLFSRSNYVISVHFSCHDASFRSVHIHLISLSSLYIVLFLGALSLLHSLKNGQDFRFTLSIFGTNFFVACTILVFSNCHVYGLPLPDLSIGLFPVFGVLHPGFEHVQYHLVERFDFIFI